MTSTRITINGQQYDSPEAMPPDVRRTYDEAMRRLASSPASGLSGGSTQVFTGQAGRLGASVVVNRTITVNDRTGPPTPVPLPVEPSTLESRIRDIPVSLAIYVVIGLVLWALLGR